MRDMDLGMVQAGLCLRVIKDRLGTDGVVGTLAGLWFSSGMEKESEGVFTLLLSRDLRPTIKRSLASQSVKTADGNVRQRHIQKRMWGGCALVC